MQTTFLDAPNYASSNFPDPRPFQITAHESLRDGARAGHRCQVVMAPTGAGKLYLGLRIAHEALKRGKRAIFICDRITLINQASKKADEYGLSAHGIFQSGHWRANRNMPFQIASAQTLARRGIDHFDTVIIDECHAQLKVTTDYIKNSGAHCVGLSATPFSKGLGLIYSNLINATTMAELVEQGTLVPMRVLSCTTVDMRGAETSGGEWTENAAAERGMEIVGDVVNEWLEHAAGDKTIGFGPTIAYCIELRDKFLAAGVRAEVFTSDTKADEREALLAEYAKPDSKIRVLLSVEALAKGFDVPDVACILDIRPLRKSLSTAIQMWGRGARSHPGKDHFKLLDFSGNIIRFKEDFEDIYFNGLDALDAGEKLDKAIRRDDDEKEPAKGCPKCGSKPFNKRCMACGFEIVKPSLVESVPGEMVEIMIGKRKLADDSRHLYEQMCAYARGNSAPEKQAGRAAHLYKDIMGTYPPKSWRFESTPSAPITAAVLNKIKQKNIAYSKARGNGCR